MGENTSGSVEDGSSGAVPSGDCVRVATDDVVVEKRFDVDSFAVPTVVYDVTSEHDDVVDLRLCDPLPDGFPTDRIGFHEEYHRDCWRLADGAVSFERTIAPGESVRTVFGVGVRSADVVDRFVTRPDLSVTSVQVTDESFDGSESTDESTEDEAVDATDLAGATGPVWDEADNNPMDRALSASDGDAGDASLSGLIDEGTAGQSDGGDAVPDDVAGRLVEQLRSDGVAEADRKRLSRELNLRASEATSDLLAELRDRLDRKRDRLRDEIEALEQRIDTLYDHVADADAIAELERAVDDLEAGKANDEAVTHLRSAVDELDEAKADAIVVSGIEDRVEDLAATAADESSLSALSDRVERMDRRKADRDETERLVESVEAIEAATARADRVDALADDLSTLSDRAARASRVASVEDVVETLDETAARRESVRDLDAELRDLEATAAEQSALTSLADRVDSLESGVAALEDASARESDLESLTDRLDEEYVPAERLETEVTNRLRRGAVDAVASVVGVSGLLVAGLLAATGTGPGAVAVVPFLVGALALSVWASRIRTEGGA